MPFTAGFAFGAVETCAGSVEGLGQIACTMISMITIFFMLFACISSTQGFGLWLGCRWLGFQDTVS